MGAVPGDGPLWDQTQTAFESAFRHMSIEARYATTVCEQLLKAAGADEERARFCRVGAATGRSALALLAALERMEASRSSSRTLLESQQWKARIEQNLGRLPDLLSVLSTSYLQRRRKGVHQLFSRNARLPHFSLSEIDLGYAMAVRGIESLADSLHSAVSSFWGDIECSPRLIAIATSSRPALRSPNLLALPELWTSQQRRKTLEDYAQALREHLAHGLNMGYFLLPRWLPTQLRFAAVLGHETFHGVLSLTDFWEKRRVKRDEFFAMCPSPDARENNEVVHKAVFSPALVRLEELRSSLREHILDFLTTHDKPQSDHDRATDHDSRFTIAHHNANELLCDLAGLVLCGPAHLYALANLRLGDPQTTDEAFRAPRSRTPPVHPPPYARVRFSVMVLEEMLGFTEHAAHFQEVLGFGRTWKCISSQRKRHPFTLDYYEELLCSGRVRGIAKEVVSLVASSAVEAGGRAYGDHGDGESEDDQVRRWVEAIAQVGDRRVLVSDLVSYAPADVINALWRWILRPDGDKVRSELGVEWLLALRNSGR